MNEEEKERQIIACCIILFFLEKAKIFQKETRGIILHFLGKLRELIFDDVSLDDNTLMVKPSL